MTIQHKGEPGGRDTVGPRSLARLLQIFEVLARAPDGMTLADLNTALGTPKSSLLNLLRPLVNDGYLVHADGTYRLGLKAFGMATNILAAWDVARAYRPSLERLAALTGETAMLAIANPVGGTLSYADVVVSNQPIRYQIPVGTTRLLHAAASGRVLLAFSDPDAIPAYLKQADLAAGMVRPFKPVALDQELAQVRAQGFAVGMDRMIEGLASIAAPVLDAGGTCLAALAIGGPSDRIEPRRDMLVETVRMVAADASAAPPLAVLADQKERGRPRTCSAT